MNLNNDLFNHKKYLIKCHSWPKPKLCEKQKQGALSNVFPPLHNDIIFFYFIGLLFLHLCQSVSLQSLLAVHSLLSLYQ